MYRIFHGKHRIYLSSDENDIERYKPDFVFKKPKEEQIKEALKVAKKATKPLKILLLGNPDKILKRVILEFKYKIAGGGIVENTKGQILLMKRLGKWDLPKGKVEKYETLEDGGKREVKEETGVKKINVGKLVGITYHVFKRNNRYQLKESHWFHMTSTYEGDLVPETKEGITKAVWKDKKKALKAMENTYPNIAYLFVKVKLFRFLFGEE